MGDAETIQRLYEAAVQTPERDIELFERAFRRRAGRAPMTLREDFCGGALTCARWVESDDEREAVGVDLDAGVLGLARERVRGLDEEERERVTLVRGDARARSERTFDLIVAMNFSWAILDDAALAEYLTAARDCLEDDGLLVLELFGGPGLLRPGRTAHALDGFTYVWEQRAYRAPWLDAAIHFERGPARFDDAFTYRFCVRPIARLRELLEAAGLGGVELLAEDRRGRYARRRGAPRAELWRGLLVASRARGLPGAGPPGRGGLPDAGLSATPPGRVSSAGPGRSSRR